MAYTIPRLDLSQLNEKETKKLDFAALIFDELNNETNKIKEEITILGENQVEHRFSQNTVPCPEKTAVKVGSRYLHANYVTTKDENITILTQYPVGSAHELYWKLVISKVSFIFDLMLEDELEGGRLNYPTGKINLSCLCLKQMHRKKLENYLKKSPSVTEIQEAIIEFNKELSEFDEPYETHVDLIKRALGFEMKFGSIHVKLLNKENIEIDTVKYVYKVTDTNKNESKIIPRFNYEKWEDYSGTSANKLLVLIDHFDNSNKNSSGKEFPIVHCRAGVGRAGTFVVARTLKNLANRGHLNKSNFFKLLKELILSGRRQRGYQFVQKLSQFKTLISFGEMLLKEKLL